MSKRCLYCGKACTSEYCFRHKPKKPIRRSAKKRSRERRAPKKRTEKSVASLKKLLWTILSRYVRLRDSDLKGFGKCISCGNIEYWKYADAGHFIPRKHTMTFSDERNVNFQCKTCNQIKEGNLEVYAVALDIKYGAGTVEELRRLAKLTKRFTKEELLGLIEVYERLLFAEFEKRKDLENESI